VGVSVGVISRRREEPRLDRATFLDRLEPARSLREPDVAQSAPEEATLAAAVRLDAERSESLVDLGRTETLAVIGAADLPPPRAQRRSPERSQLTPPAGLEGPIGGEKAQLDPPPPTAGRGDRSVGVGDQLGHDLDQVEPALGKVLAEVAAADAAAAHGGGVDHGWERRGAGGCRTRPECPEQQSRFGTFSG
jgi:hypothetical protein